MRDFYSGKICVLFVSIIILLLSCKKSASTNEDLVSLIPQNSDIIVRVNEQDGTWNNLIQSMKFATLGEELQLEFYTNKKEIILHEFAYDF